MEHRVAPPAGFLHDRPPGRNRRLSIMCAAAPAIPQWRTGWPLTSNSKETRVHEQHR
ncbi:hypothetical protein CITRIK5_20140 [Citricoccus sp. K5]|nr:hypothetical protein CITRIK5_20140 [Citricoccus sp. K5]